MSFVPFLTLSFLAGCALVIMIYISRPSYLDYLESPAGNSLLKHVIKDSSNSVGTTSLLVVITCGHWSGTSPQRALLLRMILQNYVGACEANYDVQVILVVYKEPEIAELERYLSAYRYMCTRTLSRISIDIEAFDYRPLPKGSFGTQGDLAFRYREIFTREQDNFDYFIVQENDVNIEAITLDYYIKTTELFLGSAAYMPILFSSEVCENNRYDTWRFRRGKFLKLNGNIFFAPNDGNLDSRCIIVSHHLLKNEMDRMGEAWHNVSLVPKGEFNPIVASNFIQGSTRQGLLWIDNDVWVEADVHHLPDRYIHYMDGKSHDPLFQHNKTTFITNYQHMLSMSRDEGMYIFRACEKGGVHSILTETMNVTIIGDECADCFAQNGTIRISSTIHMHGKQRRVDAHFKCDKNEER